MEAYNLDDLSWALQQDYILFLSVLGWMLGGLVAWGNATSDDASPEMPWRLLAIFCMTRAFDGILGIALLFGSSGWFELAKQFFLVLGYTTLFELARTIFNAVHHRRVPVFTSVTFGLAFLAGVYAAGQAAVFVFAGFGTAAGVWAGFSFFGRRRSSTRVLGWTAIVLFLLGPSELLSEAGLQVFFQLPINDSPISFLGLPSAVLGNLLAWIMALGLWMGVVLARRYVSKPLTGFALTSVALWLFPTALIVILLGGYYLLNWNAERVQRSVQTFYLYRVQTAALSINPEDVSELTFTESDRESDVYHRLQRQLAAIRDVSEDVRFVYLWTVREGMLVYPVDSGDGGARPESRSAFVRRRASVNDEEAYLRDYSYFMGPFQDRIGTLVVANGPIPHVDGSGTLCWLGMDINADNWFSSYANARVQTIAIVGLFSALVVFFLAYQMLRESEGDLVVAKERAEAADRAKSEFVAVMSHEIRTPLQSVLGYAELLARSQLTPSETGYLDAIRSQGRTLLRIVQDILDFSALRKTSYTLKSEPVHLRKIIELTFNTARPLADKKGLDYRLDIHPSVPAVVDGDGVRLQQILLNLLGNAVKFTPSGSITLDVTQLTVNRTVKPAIAMIEMRVTDTGIGIRREDKLRMFEPFTQLGLSQHVPREGAGLGLAIVKRLCELMGGSIDLESEPGAGSRFRIVIPMPVIAEEADPSGRGGSTLPVEMDEATVNLAAMVPLRILVADDNPFIRNLLVEYLKQLGYSPLALSTGGEAVRNWKGHDLLILDLRMPEMDGVEATARIRAESGDRERPWIIGVSATLQEPEIEKAMEAGMNDFLGKPFFVSSLQEAIQASPVFNPDAGSSRKYDPNDAGDEPVKPGDPLGDEDEPPPASSWQPPANNGGIYSFGVLDPALVQQAVDEIPTLFDEMKEGLEANDLERVRDRAHYLKNTIFALKMDELFEPCRQVHDLAGAGRVNEAGKALGLLRATFEEWKTKQG
ncbi:MAG: ATP-binding protein [Opitutaceae bacterium]